MSGEGEYWTRVMRRQFSRRAILRAGATAAGMAGLAAAGCGGGKKNNASSGGGQAVNVPGLSAGGSTAAAAPTAGSFKRGGTIQLAVTGTAPLDPVVNGSYRVLFLSGFPLSRLFRYNSGTDPAVSQTFQTVPDLVQTYENPDKLTYTMKLRQDAMFHPPLSRPLTSADVVATYQRFIGEPRNPSQHIFDPVVDSLTAVDDHTIQWKLKAPHGPFLRKLASTLYLWIQSKDAAEGKIDPAKQMIGTGPWILDSSNSTSFTFKRNPDYFVKGLPYADGAVLNIIPDTSTLEAQFQAGKIDMAGASGTGAIPEPDVEAMKKAVPKASAVSYYQSGFNFMFFNAPTSTESVFHDIRLRRAVSLAIDRDALLDLAYAGHGTWANYVPATFGQWNLDPKGKDIGSAGQWYKHDPAQAKQLLAASGQAGTTFKYMYASDAYGDVFNQLADATRGMLADAGFKLQVVTLNYLKDYIAPDGINWKGPPANSMVFGIDGILADPDDYLTGYLVPGNGRNHSQIDDKTLTDFMQKEREETDESKRLQLVHQAQQMADDLVYYPMVISADSTVFAQPWVQGMLYNANLADGTEMIAYISLNR